VLVLFALSSCKKFTEIPEPINELNTTLVFMDDRTATESVTGIYSEMMNNSTQFSSSGISLYGGMLADELYYYLASPRDEFIKNEISLSNHGTISSALWAAPYKYIYVANACLEGLDKSDAITPDVRTALSGEAKFVRAFCYFHLVNLFGDVPLVTSTDYRENARKGRTKKEDVYLQIVADLTDAQNQLSENYVTTTAAPTARTRPNKWAAAALLARVYLYTGEWQKAEAAASSVIGSGKYTLVANLNNVFLAGSTESIWQLQPVQPGRNTWEVSTIVPASNSSTPSFLLTKELVNAFEANDQRKVNWAKSRVFDNLTLYYPFKYKVRTGTAVTEHYMVLRLAELYLIRAEARARQGNVQGGKEDINILRARAGLGPTTANEQTSLLAAIEQERSCLPNGATVGMILSEQQKLVLY
jgi:hypothetical protein